MTQDVFRLLRGGGRARLARQQTLQALIDWSYDLLPAAEQDALIRMSVFRGGFDLQAAEAVCIDPNDDHDDVVDLLGALVDKSMVQADSAGGSVRYRLLETIREYAAARLAGLSSRQQEAVHRCHRDHYLALAERAAPHLNGSRQIAWLACLQTEQDNLRVALVHSLQDPDPEPGLRLAVAMRWYWRLKGAYTEGAESLARVLDRPAADDSTLLRGWALTAASHLLSYQDQAAARSLGEQALAIARAGHEPRLAADALRSISHAEASEGRWQQGLAHLDEALATARKTGDPHLTAICMLDRVSALTILSDAAACVEEALLLFETLGDPMMTSTAAGNVGYLQLTEG